MSRKVFVLPPKSFVFLWHFNRRTSCVPFLPRQSLFPERGWGHCCTILFYTRTIINHFAGCVCFIFLNYLQQPCSGMKRNPREPLIRLWIMESVLPHMLFVRSLSIYCRFKVEKCRSEPTGCSFVGPQPPGGSRSWVGGGQLA